LIEPPPPIVVGDAADVHVEEVVVQLRRGGSDPVVLDAASLSSGTLSLYGDRLDVAGAQVRQPARGWIRRLAPHGWRSTMASDSHEGARRAAWVVALTSWLETARVEWLSPFAELIASESRHRQLKSAHRLGIPVPRTVIGNDLDRVAEELGRHVICKPLGPAVFVDEGGEVLHVPATLVDLAEINPLAASGAPFVFQERISARVHVRVVVVNDRTWTCQLDATSLPVDWRESDLAHASFEVCDDREAAKSTLRLCRALGVRTASADWIDSSDGRLVFLDLNPGGQWLFLPEPVAGDVTVALASWLLEARV